MAFTERFSEMHNPLTMDYSDSMQVGGHNSSYVSLANYHRAVVVVNVGDLGLASTLDCSLLQATSTAGAGSKTISGKSATQLTATDDDSVLCFELRTEELDVDNGFDCIAFRYVIANNPVELGYIVYGIEPRFPPVGTSNWTEVIA